MERGSSDFNLIQVEKWRCSARLDKDSWKKFLKDNYMLWINNNDNSERIGSLQLEVSGLQMQMQLQIREGIKKTIFFRT